MTPQDKNNLLPCPFCGEVPDASDQFTFQCDQGDKWGYVVCCCRGPEVRTDYRAVDHWRAEAILAWNTRAIDAAEVERLERLVSEMDADCSAYVADIVLLQTRAETAEAALARVAALAAGWSALPNYPASPAATRVHAMRSCATALRAAIKGDG